MDARGKFGEREKCVRVARGAAESNSSFLSVLQTLISFNLALIMPAVPSFSMALGMWCCVVKSLNHPLALRGFQNDGDWDRYFSSTNPIHIVYPELSNGLIYLF